MGSDLGARSKVKVLWSTGHDEASGSDPMVRARENIEPGVAREHFIIGSTAGAVTFDENYAI